MSHKLIRVDWVHDMPMEDPEGQFYFAEGVDEYIEELHKRIEALEEEGGGCDEEEHF